MISSHAQLNVLYCIRQDKVIQKYYSKIINKCDSKVIKYFFIIFDVHFVKKHNLRYDIISAF